VTTINALAGAVTTTGATVKAKVTTTGGTVSVDVSQTNDFATFTTFGPVSTILQVGTVPITGLTADTSYYYRIRDNGTPDDAWVGRFRTHPGPGGNFSFILSGDQGTQPNFPGTGDVLAPTRLSNAPVLATIGHHSSNPTFGVYLGDIDYYDIGSGVHVPNHDLATYYRQWDDTFLQSNMQEWIKSMAFVYMWDDHDFGPNNSNRDSPGRDNALQAYRDRFPSYVTDTDSGACYQTWVIGRVRFIMSDTRANRDPQDNPDGPTHTMLGSDQLAWTLDILDTAEEDFLIWLMPTPWRKPTLDGWSSGYRYEQAIIANKLIEREWSDRMIMVTADIHANGICLGENNPDGGFPEFLVGPVDATPAGMDAAPWYPDGFQGERYQYCVVDVEDTGTAISATVTFYRESDVWRTVTITAGDVGPGPEPEPEPTPDVPITRSKEVHWWAVDFKTGRVLRELPAVYGEVSVALGQYTTCNLGVPVALSGPGFVDNLDGLTLPGVTMIVLELNGMIAWGGVITARKYSGERLELSCATVENYLNYRYVTTRKFTNSSIHVIMTTLANMANPNGANILIRTPSQTSPILSIEYADEDDVTVYKALGDLMAIDGAPEWTITVEWVTRGVQLRKVLTIAPQIGQPRPNVILRTRGKEAITYTYTEYYGAEYGANYIRYSGPGQGDSRPFAVASADDLILSGWPQYERRIADDVTVDLRGLEGKAAQELNRVRLGTAVWELAGRFDVITWGADWTIGDTVGWEVYSNLHPNGKTGSGRIIGYKIDPASEQITPTIVGEVPISGTSVSAFRAI
jgi:hypothetical protein